MLLSILVEVKWERGVKGHNIHKFSELLEDKLGGRGCQIKVVKASMHVVSSSPLTLHTYRSSFKSFVEGPVTCFYLQCTLAFPIMKKIHTNRVIVTVKSR